MKELIAKIETLSQKPMENKKLIGHYLSRSFGIDEIIFFDWECPPRFIKRNDQSKESVSFDVGLNDIFKGKKIDEFTEVPRIISNKEKEIKFLSELKKTGLNFKFIKLIADTNIEVVGVKKAEIKATKLKMIEFKDRLTMLTKNYPCPVEVFLFSDFIRTNKTKSQYDLAYQFILDGFLSNKTNLNTLLDQQIKHIQKHMGIKNQTLLLNIAKKTIASYAAEGVSFATNKKALIWLNSSEANKRTILITNLLRKEKLPMIFI